MKRMVYADNAATTQLDIDAFEAMKPFLLTDYGNASQPYSFARSAKKALKESRETIAKCIGALPEEINVRDLRIGIIYSSDGNPINKIMFIEKEGYAKSIFGGEQIYSLDDNNDIFVSNEVDVSNVVYELFEKSSLKTLKDAYLVYTLILNDSFIGGK